MPPETLARLRSLLAQLPLDSLPPRALEVGCGAYPAARVLAEVLPGWVLYGIDCDGEALRHARQEAPSLRLLQADALQLPGLLCARFGLILVRHPDLYRHLDTWRAIIGGLPSLLPPRGVLVITLYTPEEVDAIHLPGLPPLFPLDENALAPVDLDGRDRFVVVVNL